jgi:hypothetical protein
VYLYGIKRTTTKTNIMKKQVKAGKHTLTVEKINSRYVVRTEKGAALTLGATKQSYEALLKEVAAGVYDNYISGQ